MPEVVHQNGRQGYSRTFALRSGAPHVDRNSLITAILTNRRRGAWTETSVSSLNAVWRGDTDKARQVGAMDGAMMTELFDSDSSSIFGSPQVVFKAALNPQEIPSGYVRPPCLNLDDTQTERVWSVFRRRNRVVR